MPVEQVLAEAPLGDQRVGRSWLVAATTRMSACTSSVPPSRRKRRSCSTRSSFTCIVGVHLADLVEEDGAALGDLDQPLLVGVGAR